MNTIKFLQLSVYKLVRRVFARFEPGSWQLKLQLQTLGHRYTSIYISD